MDILVMGGTRFLGRGIVEAALAAGHKVTLFNRGRSGADLFPACEQLRGDRLSGDLATLEGRRFDAVIDVSAYIPRVVRDVLSTVDTAHYTFISTISVYADNSVPGQDESAELVTLDDPTTETVDGETYGGLKVLCEQAADAMVPGRVLHVRSGLIVGPHDTTDRFTYWPVRVAQGGPMLAPNSPDDPLQFIDVRDEADWIIRSVEAGLTGAFNVTGSPDVTFGDVLATARSVSGSAADFRWVSQEWMEQHNVAPWSDMPLWVPSSGASAGFHRYRIDKALAHGLRFRPLTDTIAATLAWFATLPPDYVLKTGISAEREAQLLADL